MIILQSENNNISNLIIQWGISLSNRRNNFTVSFNNVLFAILNTFNDIGNQYIVTSSIGNLTTSTFDTNTENYENSEVAWIAIGN